MTDCQWERFKATRAPMHSQQRQVLLCTCTPCRNARLMSSAVVAKGRSVKLQPKTAERLAVLSWKPEPPPDAA